MTGLAPTLGYGPGNPDERDQIEPHEVDYKPSKLAQTGPVQGKTWTRLYTGRDITQPDPVAASGHEVELGELTPEGAESLVKFVNHYDNTSFEVTGVDADNCATFALKVADQALGLEIEPEPGHHDTSASAGAKIEAASARMKQSTSRDRYPFLNKP